MLLSSADSSAQPSFIPGPTAHPESPKQDRAEVRDRQGTVQALQGTMTEIEKVQKIVAMRIVY